MSTPGSSPLLIDPPLGCLVVDDAPLAIQIIHQCIAGFPTLRVSGSCSSALAALELLRAHSPDVLFLDVDLPLLSGLDLLRLLRHQGIAQPSTVLVTSSATHAVEAFEYAVADYLLKPITPTRFAQAVQKVTAALAATRPAASAAPSLSPAAPHLFLKVNNQLERVDFADVYYLEACGNYVRVVTQAKKLLTLSTLQAMARRFPSGWLYSAHRSFFVNLRYVSQVEERELVLGGTYRLPISAGLRPRLLQQLNLL